MHVELWRLGVSLDCGTLVGAPPPRFRLRSRLSLVFSVLSKSVHDRLMGSKMKAQMRFQTRARSKEAKQLRGRAGRLGARAGWQGRERTEWWSGGGRFGAVIPRFSCHAAGFGRAHGLRRSSKRSPWRIRLQMVTITLEKTFLALLADQRW